jgi:hypothetical protein
MQRYRVIEARPRTPSRNVFEYEWGTDLPDRYRGYRPPGATDRAILEDTARRLIAQLHRAGFPDVERIGSGPLFDRERPGKLGGKDAIVYPLVQDPIYLRGDYPVPPEVDHRLETMARLGISFPAAYVVHELSPEWAKAYRERGTLPVGALAPIDPEHDPGRVVRTELARLGAQGAELAKEGMDRTARELEKAGPRLRTAGKVVGAVALAAGALAVVAAASAAAAIAADPILIGGVTLSGRDNVGEHAVFVRLATWIYAVPSHPSG